MNESLIIHLRVGRDRTYHLATAVFVYFTAIFGWTLWVQGVGL